ncbi:hypothetical protein ACWGF2_19940 [Streptomyces sp. NPDC054919]
MSGLFRKDKREGILAPKDAPEPNPGERGIAAGHNVALGIPGDDNVVTVEGDVVTGDQHHHYQTVRAPAAQLSRITSLVDRHTQAEQILIGPLNTEHVAPLLRQADTQLPTDPRASARIYGDIAAELQAAGFLGHSVVMYGKQLAALKAAGSLHQATSLAAHLAMTALQFGDRDRAQNLARNVEELARGLDSEDPQAGMAQRHARLLRTAVSSLFHPLGEMNALITALQAGTEADDPAYRPVLVLLAAEQTLAFEPDRVRELAEFVDGAIATLKGTEVEGASEDSLIRLRLVRSHYDPAEHRDLLRTARRHQMPARHAALVHAREGRRQVMAENPEEAVDAYRDAVNAAIREGLPQDAADWLYSIRGINAWYGPWTVDLDDEHRLAQALRTTGTGRLLERPRSPREQALSAVIRKKNIEAVLAAQRWLVDAVVTGDWTGELEALRFLADRYRDSKEPQRAAAYYQRAGADPETIKEHATDASDIVLPVGPLRNVPWWTARSRAAQLEAQADLVDDNEVCAYLDDLLCIARQTLAGEIADAPQHSLYRQAVLSACALAHRGTAEQAREVLANLVTGMEAATCLRVAQAHPELALHAATKLFDLATDGTDEVLALLADDRMVTLLTTSELTDEDQAPLRSRLVDLADADRYLAGIALCEVDPDHPIMRAKTVAARDRILSRPAPDAYRTAFGTRLVPDSYLVSTIDVESRRLCAEKLMGIASDRRETADSRRDALTGTRNLVIDLPSSYKEEVFKEAKGFVLGEQDGSHLDSEVTGTPHPLSSFRISFGTSSLRGPALKLAQVCTPNEDQFHWVRDQAVALLRSDILSDVYDAAVTLTRLPPETTMVIEPGLLAAHSDRRVRQAGVILAARRAAWHIDTIRQLARDPDYTIRRTLAEAATTITREDTAHPVLHEVLDLLVQDPRASVRQAARAAHRTI